MQLLHNFTLERLKYNLCLITNDNSYKKMGIYHQDILDLKILDLQIIFTDIRGSRNNKGISDIREIDILKQLRNRTGQKLKNIPPFSFTLLGLTKSASTRFHLVTISQRNMLYPHGSLTHRKDLILIKPNR